MQKLVSKTVRRLKLQHPPTWIPMAEVVFRPGTTSAANLNYRTDAQFFFQAKRRVMTPTFVPLLPSWSAMSRLWIMSCTLFEPKTKDCMKNIRRPSDNIRSKSIKWQGHSKKFPKQHWRAILQYLMLTQITTSISTVRTHATCIYRYLSYRFLSVFKITVVIEGYPKYLSSHAH